MIKRALRNSLILSLVVAAILVYQQQPALDIVLTALFTFAITFPALWLSFIASKRINGDSDDQHKQE